jgi:hypothetical protein
MVPAEFVVPYVIANVFALVTLVAAWRWPDAVRWVGAGVFAWAAAINTWTALTNPQVYVEYATLTPSALYRSFILGWFREHVALMVLPIAAGQLMLAAGFASPHRMHRRLAVAGAVVFLLAIAPLGVGAGFPFSLTFGAALLLAVRTPVPLAADRRAPAADSGHAAVSGRRATTPRARRAARSR